jgi:hypothetical protein
MMTGKDGRISFTKVVIVDLLVAQWFGKAPGVLWATAILAASFGAKMFLAWIDRKAPAA